MSGRAPGALWVGGWQQFLAARPRPAASAKSLAAKEHWGSPSPGIWHLSGDQDRPRAGFVCLGNRSGSSFRSFSSLPLTPCKAVESTVLFSKGIHRFSACCMKSIFQPLVLNLVPPIIPYLHLKNMVSIQSLCIFSMPLIFLQSSDISCPAETATFSSHLNHSPYGSHSSPFVTLLPFSSFF